MNAAPVLVFRIDLSRKPLKVWANGASAEPEVAVATAHDFGANRREVVELVVELWLIAVLVIVAV